VNPFTSPAVVNGGKAKAPPHGFGRHKRDVHAYRNYFHRIRNGTFVEVGAGDGELHDASRRQLLRERCLAVTMCMRDLRDMSLT